ncbi:MAG TPA: tRNA threonylcarbamoyladenosine dehydratase [Clostridiales bacterium]|nr:tRNA threonylcarbamoyladenosine dehydratase [Clostridiales bacterium]
MLLGADAIERLQNSHVAVFGLGGVGSWCAEALARSGIGELTLVDQDTVAESNINRQLVATHGTIGRSKARVMADRIADISPDIKAHPVCERYEAENRERFFQSRYDYIVDAIDLVACKLDLIETSLRLGIPIISALGAGNKLDASLMQICDISKTRGCALARVMRRELRRRGINHHTVVYSPEESVKPQQAEEPPPGRRSVPGSLVWVTATSGMLLAQHVVLSLSKG